MNAVDAYHTARQREGRLLGDEVVRELPFSGDRTPYTEEWRVRARSLKRAVRILHDRPRNLLEVGCGNGWLSARLSAEGHTITGLDTGTLELEQAKRVFRDRPITWILGDPWVHDLPAHGFDVILFAASIQYFPALPALLKRCHALLKHGGEILVVDSHFYTDATAAERARTRSLAYYTGIGVPEMATHYHHHTRQAIIEAAAGAYVRIIPPRGRAVGSVMGHYPFPIVHIRV